MRNIFWTRVPEPHMKYHVASTKANASTSKPVVLMIGWAGAANKHMEKYSKLYNDKGYDVALICPPTFSFTVPNNSIGKRMLPILEKYGNSPIMIHSFSINGIRGIVSLAKATGNPKLFDNVQGIIFDSAPSIPFPHQNGKAMMLSTPSVTYMKDETRQKIYELVNAVRDKLLSPLVTLLPFLRPYFFSYWYIHDKIELPKRQVYFYSHGDSMVPYDLLEKFVEIQRKRGCHVENLNFGDTEHVAHFRAKPAVYSDKCVEFISKL